jgi:HEAT repeat protein
VRSDLERELAAAREGVSQPEFDSEPPDLGSFPEFTDRVIELEALASAFQPQAARVGVVGPAGIGKTTLVQEFFRRNRERLPDPIWLRVEELFGRDAFGHLKVGAPRWTPASLAAAIGALRKQRPRAALVFDNVQAAPLAVRQVVDRLGSVRGLFLAWDTIALPAGVRAIHVPQLSSADARTLLEQFCDVGQRLESGPLAEVVERTGGDPLLISLAGRRLASTPGLTVLDFVHDLRASHEELLRLEGPTVDRPSLQVRALLKNVYQCLEPGQRAALTALGSLPSRGISEDSMAWAVARFRPECAPRLDRAAQVGLLEARTAPDYRGHRYRLRGVVSDFLRTTDARAAADRAAALYLLSEEALRDLSCDIVGEGLRQQLRRDAPDLPSQGAWVVPLLVEARPVIRARAGQVLQDVRDDAQRDRLAGFVAAALGRPSTETVTLELVHLLGEWANEAAGPALERLWLNPRTQEPAEDGFSLYDTVTAAAGKALARLEGSDYPSWLLGRMKGRAVQATAALRAAASDKLESALPRITSCLSHSDRLIRAAACEALASYEPRPHLADQLFVLRGDDRSPDVREQAELTLGVWADERVLGSLLSVLDDLDEDRRATAVSILWRYRRRDVADRLFDLAQRRDVALNTKTSIAFVLTDFLDSRASDVALSVMDSADRYSQGVGPYAAGMLADLPGLGPERRRMLVDRLGRFVTHDDRAFRLRARAALIALGKESGLDGLWADLDRRSSDDTPADTERWFAVLNLASAPSLRARLEAIRLRPLIDDRDPQMRAAAALVAGQLRAVELVPYLEGLIDDDGDAGAVAETVASVVSEALDRIAGRLPPWIPHKRLPVAQET